MPVDSTTRSTPRSPHGSVLGSRTARTWSTSPSTEMPSLCTLMSYSRRPSTESYFSRCAIAATDPRSFTATKSISALRFFAARKKLRPMRPKPLIPTRTVMRKILSQVRKMSLYGSTRCVRMPHRRWPPGGTITLRGPLVVDIAMGHRRVVAQPAQHDRHLLGDHDRTVVPAGAAEGHGEIRLAL